MIVLLIASFMSMFYDQMNDIDRVSEDIVCQLEQKIEPRGLELIGTGGACKEGKISLVSVTFNLDKVLNIDTAREEIVMVIHTLLQLINNNPKNKEYFHVFPATTKQIWVTIFGEIKLGPCDFVSSVSIRGNDIRYYQEDPVNYIINYTPILKETYEEAKHQLSMQKGIP